MEKCKYAAKCGGCTHLQKTYEEQLAIKQNTVKELMKPFGQVQPILGMENPYHYRNKVHAVFSSDKKGVIQAGTYEPGTHRVVDIDSCLIDNEKADAIILTIKQLMKSFKYRAFNEDTGRGFIRHVLIRTAQNTGQIMVVIVVGELIFPSKNNFIKALRNEHPEITTILTNLNDRRTSMVLGDREQTLFGPGYIEDVLCGKKFKISAKSFYQVNPLQTEVLYKKALELAALTGKEKILDAYSGIGTIGIIASDLAGQVIGVELNKDAVKDAQINCKLNGVKNARYFQGDAGAFMEQEAADQNHYDLVFLDPPRAGSDEKFLASLAKLAPPKVVYISCNPETLARDLKYLERKGYSVKKCVPLDMFPWTDHVETVVKLERR